MKIGIEAERANHPIKTGVEHYAKQLILQLAALDSQNEYVLYLRTKPESWFLDLPKNFTVKILGYGPIPFPYLWTQLRLSWEMVVNAPDVLFVPAASLPLVHPKRTIITVHDVAWRFYPETFNTLKRWYLEFTTWFACKFAKQIIAVSQATKDDLMNVYGVSDRQVTVIHHGYDATALTDAPASEEVRGMLPEKYVLYLGTIQPRKNIIGLIDAFMQLKHEHPDLAHKLVIVGRIGWKPEETLERMQNSEIVYLGHVADDDRWYILRHADVYVLPSFYEGFGMPILEAFSVGTAVATSNVSSMPEVAEDAAVYFDPRNVRDIKQALQNVLYDTALRTSLVEKGKRRLNSFSWERCGKETLTVLTSQK
jgi:glycosyltransferase involved in cell wall biosynthesis